MILKQDPSYPHVFLLYYITENSLDFESNCHFFKKAASKLAFLRICLQSERGPRPPISYVIETCKNF